MLQHPSPAIFGSPRLSVILLWPCHWQLQLERQVMMMMVMRVMIMMIVVGCTQIPISTFSHIWVFVRLYGIMFVIIVIAIIIIIIIKSEGVNAQL